MAMEPGLGDGDRLVMFHQVPGPSGLWSASAWSSPRDIGAARSGARGYGTTRCTVGT